MLVYDQAKSLEVVKALADEYSTKILLSIMAKPLSVVEICQIIDIPISTCYRRIRALEIGGIIRVERTIFTEDGKKFMRYASIIKNATISFDLGNLQVDVSLKGIPEFASLILTPEIAN